MYRAEYGRVVSSLVRRLGDIDIVEEAAGEDPLAAAIAATEPPPSARISLDAGGAWRRSLPP
jgi:predicted RNA polymerase sigma factor